VLVKKKMQLRKNYEREGAVSIFIPFLIHSICVREDLQNITKNILIVTPGRDTSLRTPHQWYLSRRAQFSFILFLEMAVYFNLLGPYMEHRIRNNVYRDLIITGHWDRSRY
jgi:predicted HAD superfamily phosphohydrolase